LSKLSGCFDQHARTRQETISIELGHDSDQRLTSRHVYRKVVAGAETFTFAPPMSPEIPVSRSSSRSTALGRSWPQTKRENCEPNDKNPDPDA